MKMFLRGTAAAVGLLALLAVGASAQETQPAPQDETGRARRQERLKRGGWQRHGRRGPGHGLRGLGGLNLSDAQREQLRSFRESLRQSTAAQRNELRQIYGAGRQGGQLTDEQRARARQLHEELRQAAEQYHQQMLGVLTPEQRAQLEERQQERLRRREERRQRREEFRRRRQGQSEIL